MSELDDQQDEVLRGKGRRESGGATLEFRDSRVSTGIQLLLGLLAAGLLAIGGWIGSTLVGLRESVAVIVSQNAAVIQRLDKNEDRDDRQEDHINAIDGRVRVVEQVTGVQMRGGPKERTNGR